MKAHFLHYPAKCLLFVYGFLKHPPRWIVFVFKTRPWELKDGRKISERNYNNIWLNYPMNVFLRPLKFCTKATLVAVVNEHRRGNSFACNSSRTFPFSPSDQAANRVGSHSISREILRIKSNIYGISSRNEEKENSMRFVIFISSNILIKNKYMRHVITHFYLFYGKIYALARACFGHVRLRQEFCTFLCLNFK